MQTTPCVTSPSVLEYRSSVAWAEPSPKPAPQECCWLEMLACERVKRAKLFGMEVEAEPIGVEDLMKVGGEEALRRRTRAYEEQVEGQLVASWRHGVALLMSWDMSSNLLENFSLILQEN